MSGADTEPAESRRDGKRALALVVMLVLGLFAYCAWLMVQDKHQPKPLQPEPEEALSASAIAPAASAP